MRYDGIRADKYQTNNFEILTQIEVFPMRIICQLASEALQQATDEHGHDVGYDPYRECWCRCTTKFYGDVSYGDPVMDKKLIEHLEAAAYARSIASKKIPYGERITITARIIGEAAHFDAEKTLREWAKTHDDAALTSALDVLLSYRAE